MNIIATADWHLRTDTPVCRTDDFLKVQEKTLQKIAFIARKEKAVICVAGDIFHRAKNNRIPYLINLIQDIFNDIQVYYIPGNHDLLYKSIDYYQESDISMLEHLPSFNFYNRDLPYLEMIHIYVAENEVPFYINDGINAKELLDRTDCNVLIAGDNHQKFIVDAGLNILINPGSITRQASDKKNYIPSVYLFEYVEGVLSEIEAVRLVDTDPSVIQDDYLIEEKRKNLLKNNSFIELLKDNKELSLDFESTVEYLLSKEETNDKVKVKVKNYIWEAINGSTLQ